MSLCLSIISVKVLMCGSMTFWFLGPMCVLVYENLGAQDKRPQQSEDLNAVICLPSNI